MIKTTFLRMLPALAMAVVVVWAADVSTDYDHKADFSRYHTYSWLGIKAGNSLWQGRIQSSVDQALSAKGWRRVDSGGDAAVSAFGKTTEQDNMQTFYDGFPGWRWGGFGESTTQVVPERIGNLTVDVFDGNSKHLIWRGTASETLSSKPDKNERKLEKSVDEMMKHFPPQPKG